jgi:TrpR family trp operon transcriptional repressor
MTHTQKLHLITSLLSQAHHDDLEWVLIDLLTPAEIREISDRIHILQLLRSGKTQRDIATELGISITTVSRGSRVLQYGGQVITKYI